MASRTHVFAGSLGGPCTGSAGACEPGELSEPTGVAVNDSTGDVYVVDSAENRVEQFSSTGTYLSSFNGSAAPTGALVRPTGVAIDNSTNPLDPSAGDVYVIDGGLNVIYKFSSSGIYEGQISEAESGAPFSRLDGVAVATSGTVWAYQATGEIDEFSDALNNGFVSSRVSQAPGSPNPGLAVDSEGNLYVVSREARVVSKLNEQGEVLKEEIADEEAVSGIAFDSSSGEVYFDKGSSVSELSSEGNLLEAFGSGHLSGGNGIAVNASTGAAYVADATSDTIDIFKEAGPEVTLNQVSDITPASATLNGDVDPENEGSVSSCRFEYGNTESYGSTAPCSPASESGGSPVAVTASLAGLQPDTTYYYRLAATNNSGTNVTQAQEFTAAGPGIREESAEKVLSTSAMLLAQIDPNGADTTYHFEYDTSEYGSSSPHGTSLPTPNADLGSGASAVPVSVQLSELQPGTSYYYRVVATSELAPGLSETFDGPDRTLTTSTAGGQLPGSTQSEECPNEQRRAEQPYAQQLPDCRAYEMVSPLDKNDNDVAPNDVRAAVSGEAVTYYSRGAFGDPASARVADRYIARRGPDGWSTQNISPPYQSAEGDLETPFEELLFTPDLSKGIVFSDDTPLTDESIAGYPNLYVANTSEGAPVSSESSYQLVTTVNPPELPPYEEVSSRNLEAEGTSTDLSHVVFQEYANLTSEASPEHTHVYEWIDGKLSLVDLPPEGMTLGAEDHVGMPGNNYDASDKWHAVSSDGSRVFFTGGDSAYSSGRQSILGQLYVRETEAARTIEVSASQKTNGSGPGGTDPNGPGPARFWGANADGSKVFFTSRSELTNDANTGPADNAANLYEYNLETGVLDDLTVDTNTGEANGADVLGLVTASEDGSYVYFVADGVLAAGATPGNCEQHETSEGQPPSSWCNLYLSHDGETKFIATLAGADEHDWRGDEPQYQSTSEVDYGPEGHTVRVTPNGTRLAFESVRSLTGYENQPAEPADCENERQTESVPCREVYLYNATTGTIACASCDPSGARPVGAAELGGVPATEEFRLPSTSYIRQNLSEDGERLFFESPDPLVPHDSNGLLDVYEYENGQVYPISNVAGKSDSYFLDASPNGGDVFIATADQLVPSDTDDRIDVYDVRVDGGFPVSIAPPECENADSCKAPVSPQPGVFGMPASATFSGAGNLPPTAVEPATKREAKPEKCKKSQIKRHGKCVKRKVKKKPRKSDGRSDKARR
jgi:DNA-binding beta-propeller fold protein YncE